MKKTLIIILAVVAVVLIGIFTAQGVKNSAIRMEEQISNSVDNIKTEEKRRFDLIPNLVECVKAYDEHEYKTLTDVVAARGQNNGATADEIKTMIAAVAEAYPDLKSQKNYQDLMNELAITENKISDHRKVYNRNIAKYNQFVRQFPNKQFLNMANYDVQTYERLEFENTSVDAPKVSF